jgi:DNA-binding beta-propeller fold protein YncE
MNLPKRVLRPLALLIIVLSSGSCAVPPADRPAKQELAAALVWPKSPELARMRYVRSIDGAEDWGIAKGFFERLRDSLTGQADSRFVRPTGVVERAGVLFVADPGAQALFIFDATRQRVLTVDRLGEELLVSPVAVALGPADTVFLVDSWLKKVFVIDREGKLRRTLADQRWARPAAAAYDTARDRLYVADSMAHQILVYAADGSQLKTFGGNGRENGEFNSPTHLALAGDGNLLVTDALNFRIQIFDPAGNFLRKMGGAGDGAGDFAAPKGVAVDHFGQIYVADALFNAVQIFSREGALLLGLGEFGTRAGQFSLPGGLFIDPLDTLYVADAYNQRIQVFRHLPETVKESAP